MQGWFPRLVCEVEGVCGCVCVCVCVCLCVFAFASANCGLVAREL